MGRQVFLFEREGKTALGFDTGLDSRAFAQARFAQLITEPGFIVRPNCAIETWKASGVAEVASLGNDARPVMVVWGPPFEGERLDLLASDTGQKDKALAAICSWLQAVLALSENHSLLDSEAVLLWPCASLIADNAVFFAPPSLARRCVSPGCEPHVHPDLGGIEGAAFAAAAMLYQVFAGTPPFTANYESLLQQDMREGNFLPVHLAAPGLDGRLAALIKSVLAPPGKAIGGKAALCEFLSILRRDDRTVAAADLIKPVAETERILIEKEKAQFLKVKAASVKARRFIARYTALLLGGLAAVAAAVIIAVSVASSRAALPSTAGLEPVQVIETYYNAIGELDHQMMEACVLKGAGKDDIGAVVNFFVIAKVRQAYEFNIAPPVISAREWQEGGGGQVDSHVFGVTDLQITGDGDASFKRREERRGSNWQHGKNPNTGRSDSKSATALDGAAGDIDTVYFQADYTLWVPVQADEEPTAIEAPEYLPPQPHYRSDLITLVRKKGNWRISEIARSSR